MCRHLACSEKIIFHSDELAKENENVFSYGLRLTHCSFHVGNLHVRMCFFGRISLARVFILHVTEFSLSSYHSSSTSWRWILLF